MHSGTLHLLFLLFILPSVPSEHNAIHKEDAERVLQCLTTVIRQLVGKELLDGDTPDTTVMLPGPCCHIWAMTLLGRPLLFVYF